MTLFLTERTVLGVGTVPNPAAGENYLGFDPLTNTSGELYSKDSSGKLTQYARAPWVNAVDFGADPTWTTDSTTAINNAITFVSSSSQSPAVGYGVVYLPPGDYIISGNINLPSYICLVGAGQFQTRLRVRSTTTDVITAGVASRVEGLWLLATSTTTSGSGTLSGTPQSIAVASTADLPASGTGSIALTNGTWTTIAWTGISGGSLTGCTGAGAFSLGANVFVRSAGVGINCGSNSLVVVRSVRMDAMYIGIQFSGVDVTITDCDIHYIVQYSININGSIAEGLIHNINMDNYTANQPAALIEISQCGATVISDCQIIHGVIGLDINATGAGVFSVYAVNSFFDSCKTAALQIQGTPVQRCKFEQCWFSSVSAGSGVLINSSTAAAIDFTGCEVGNNSANGFSIPAALDISITHCRISGNPTAGINISAAIANEKLHIDNNQIGQVGASGFGVNGTGLILAAGAYGLVNVSNNDLANNTTPATITGTATTMQLVGNTGIAGSGRALTSTPTAITTAETVAGAAVSIPAGSLQVGTTYRITATGTISAAAAGTILARIRLGTAGTTADTQVAATAAAGAVTTAVGWFVTGTVTIRTTGSGGTMVGNLMVIVNATAAQLSAQSATTAVNTTVANFIELTLIGAGTTPSISVITLLIEAVQQ